MRAVIYVRYSPRPDRFAGDGSRQDVESNDLQLDECRQLCVRHGWRHTHYADEELSGDDENRPGLWAAIADLGRGDKLVVYKLDRLSRSPSLALRIAEELDRRGAELISTKGEGTEGKTPEDELIRGILVQLAAYQKKSTAARVSDAMRRKQALGQRMTSPGCLPYGWAADPATVCRCRDGVERAMRMLRVEEEWRIIERIVRLRREGTGTNKWVGYRAIATKLNSEGSLRRGKPWHAAQVRRVLQRQR